MSPARRLKTKKSDSKETTVSTESIIILQPI